MLNSDFPAKKEGKKRKVHMMRYAICVLLPLSPTEISQEKCYLREEAKFETSSG